MQPCYTVATRPLPRTFYESFKTFKISASKFGILPTQMRACIVEFLAKVTECVVHSVYKVVTPSSFGVTQRHKVSGGKWTFHHS